MENRSRYRSAPGRSRARRSRVYTQRDYRETILVQCIICSILMACMFMTCLVKAPLTQNIRGDVKRALAGETDMPVVSYMLTALDGMKNSVQTIFSEPTDQEGKLVGQKTNETAEPPKQQAYDLSGSELEPDFRIDEDILAKINASEDFYGDSLKKQMVLLGDISTEPTQTPAR